MATMLEYAERKKKIREYLGGRCVECGCEDTLEIDHIDHNSKSFTILDHWGWTWDKLKPELDLCQLLCKPCHLKKSIEEGSLAKGESNKPRLIHGTIWTYKKHKCRCVLCIEARKRESTKERLRVQKQGIV